MKATLILENGMQFVGESFGYESNVVGEVVFNTGMIGYPETLSDPSYRWQILIATYPIIGNYGVPDFDIRDSFGIKSYYESDSLQITALIVSEYSEDYHHFEATVSLGELLKQQKIPAIHGIDTRALTLLIREHGCMAGKIVFENQVDTLEFIDPNERPLAYEVSTKEIIRYHAENPIGKTLLVVDMWVKNNMLRHFLALGVDIIRVPGEYPFMELEWEFDGVFLSNGPGDPTKYEPTIAEVRKAIEKDKKIFGICLGNQLLALASGARTYKLPYWHRGQNQPVKDLRTGKCILTSQNHSFAIDESTLPSYIKPSMKNINDGTNEWIYFEGKEISSVQFHPESSPGPHDSTYLFEDFIRKL